MAAYFNRALFKRNLIRFWPLAALCFLTAFFVFIAPELGRDGSGNYYTGWSNREILSSLSGYCASAVPVFSAFASLAVFGYLHNARAANYISSLPISRKGLFITNYISGMALTLIPNLIIGIFFGLTLIGEQVGIAQYLAWFGIMTAAHLLFYSLAVFCAFLTGNPFMQIFLYTLINFLYPLLFAIATVIGESLVYGFIGSIPFWGVFSPPIAMVYTMWPLYRDGGGAMAFIIWMCYLALTALLIWGGYQLYRRRRIESAGDVIIHNPLKPVFKYAMAFLLGAFIGALMVALTGGFNYTYGVRLIVSLAVSVSFFGALSCLFLEMLIRKRLKVWRTAWKGILCYICAVIALALLIRLDVTGFERRVPDAEEVEAVSVMRWNTMDSALLYDGGGVLSGSFGTYYRNMYVGGNGWELSREYVDRQIETGRPMFNDAIIDEIKLRYPEYYESPDGIAAAISAHHAVIGDKNRLESLLREPTVAFVVTYKMKDGSAVTRRYNMPRSDEYELESVSRLSELYNSGEAVSKRNRFLSLPENELLGAVAYLRNEMVAGAYKYAYPHQSYTGEYPYVTVDKDITLSPLMISGGDLKTLLSAMRQDANAGTLGHVGWTMITDYNYYNEGMSDTLISLSLCYDEGIIPAAFMTDSISDGENTPIYGYVLHISIDKTCVNTVKTLEDLGLYKPFAASAQR